MRHVDDAAFDGHSRTMAIFNTPFGKSIAQYNGADEFYKRYPNLYLGWPHADESAPKGGDLCERDGWKLIFCVPGTRDKATTNYDGSMPGVGVLVAFEYESETVYLLAEDLTFEQAKKFKS